MNATEMGEVQLHMRALRHSGLAPAHEATQSCALDAPPCPGPPLSAPPPPGAAPPRRRALPRQNWE